MVCLPLSPNPEDLDLFIGIITYVFMELMSQTPAPETGGRRCPPSLVVAQLPCDAFYTAALTRRRPFPSPRGTRVGG